MYSAANQLSEVKMAMIKYKNHPSIKAITDRMEKLVTRFLISNSPPTRKQKKRLTT